MNPENRIAEQLTMDPAKPINEQKAKPKDTLFRSLLQKIYPSKPESLPSSQALESFKFNELNFQTEKGKKMLYTILRRHGLIFRSVKLKGAFAIPTIDFKFHSDEEKKVIEIFLKNLHPTSGLLQLESIIRDWYIDTVGFGTGYLDPVWDNKKMMITALKKIHPIEIDLIRDSGFGEGGKVKLDKDGNPEGWIQKVDDTLTKTAPFLRYAYLTFNTFGDEWLGVSDLEPIYQTTWRLMNIEEGVATAIYRHGFPLYDVQVSGGVDGRPPTKEQLDNAAAEVMGLNYKSEFIHGPNYKISLLESFSIGKSSDYMDPFIDQIAAASGIPKFILLGSAKDLSKASAPELLKIINPSLKPSRDKLKLVFEEQILKPLMEANHIDTTPELIINDIPLLDVKIEEQITKKAEEDVSPLEEKEELQKEIKELQRKKEEIKKEESTNLYEISLLENHASLLIKGEKKQIIKSKKEGKEIEKYIGKETYLVEDGKKLAVIKLREPREIGINEFVHLEYAHQISDEERNNFWPEEKTFYAYEFDLIRKMKEED